MHIELQSTNEVGMALRMAEYALFILRKFCRLPTQVVLYVGQPRLSMGTRLEGPNLNFTYRMIDAGCFVRTETSVAVSRRFGPLPDWAQKRVASMSVAEPDVAEDRLLNSASLQEALQ